MMARSQSFASDICAFLHPETILLPDFISTLNYAYKLDRDWLLVASSRNISYIPFYFDESKRHFPTEDKKLSRLQKVLRVASCRLFSGIETTTEQLVIFLLSFGSRSCSMSIGDGVTVEE